MLSRSSRRSSKATTERPWCCASTLVVIGHETGSWVWPVVTFVYMTVLAWLGAFAIYRLGLFLGW